MTLIQLTLEWILDLLLSAFLLSVINGVKDMPSFRETFHFNSTNSSCSEDVKESTLLVRE